MATIVVANWAFMKRFEVRNDQHGLYLRRLRIVQTPRFAIYLHRFYRPDSEPDVHDHPWPFATLILRGGYSERWTPNPGPNALYFGRTWRRWSWHKIALGDAHSIVTIAPKTTTLVFVGRRVKEWGFWKRTGWQPWQEYLGAIGDPDPFAANS